MRSRQCLYALFAMFVMASQVGAQQVTGRVVDQGSGQPMSAVQVSISGTGTSSSQRPGSARVLTSACIVFCTRKKLGESGKQERTKSGVRDQKIKLPERICVMLWTKLFSIGMMENNARDA